MSSMPHSGLLADDQPTIGEGDIDRGSVAPTSVAGEGGKRVSAPFQISRIGHVVLRVRDVDASSEFYCDVMGLREVARGDFGEGTMAFLSSGNTHHDLALVQGDPNAARESLGLHHFAFKIGDDISQLAAAKTQLEGKGVVIHATFDFRVSKSLIVSDPDGNAVELYVDSHPEEWRTNPAAVASAAPLLL
jgi:catechol-2,3-dioxygenase